jgi:hypothetical protein
MLLFRKSISIILVINNIKNFIPKLKATIIPKPEIDKLNIIIYISICVIFAIFKVLLSIPFVDNIFLSFISSSTDENSDINAINITDIIKVK